MNLNELIMESIKTTITEGKGKQQTSVQFGGSAEPGIKDENVEAKDKASVEGGLKSDIAKENKTPQGEGGKEAIPVAQKNPKLAAAVTAGIMGVNKKGIGAKDNKSPNVPAFAPPAPATK
jgi:hypothetical protein